MTKQPPPSKPSDVLYISVKIVDHAGDGEEKHWVCPRPELRLPRMPKAWGQNVVGAWTTKVLEAIRDGRDMTETTVDICTAHKLPETIGVFERFDTHLLSLGADTLEVVKPIEISLRPSNGEFIASVYGTTIATQGETTERAVVLLQSLIADIFGIHEATAPDLLGEALHEQQRVLFEHVRRK